MTKTAMTAFSHELSNLLAPSIFGLGFMLLHEHIIVISETWALARRSQRFMRTMGQNMCWHVDYIETELRAVRTSETLS